MTELKITAEAGSLEVRTEREVNAPRDLVFRAFTEPELLVQWLGPRKYEMEIDRYELRDGGRWRYTHRDDAGTEFAFHGVIHGMPTPDAMIQTGMADGVREGYERLDEVLAKLVANS